MSQQTHSLDRRRDPRIGLILPACFAFCAVALGASSAVSESAGFLHASRSALIIGFVGLRRASSAALDVPPAAEDANG